ncbi:hypothetical protein EMIT048CA2_70027 [Pseudomonas chlororaphis]
MPVGTSPAPGHPTAQDRGRQRKLKSGGNGLRVTRDLVKKLLPQSFHVTKAGAYGNEAPAFFRLEKPHNRA